jgi:hypothetical protein
MANPDYFTVMESRIRYFQLKYDPENKLMRNPGAKKDAKTLEKQDKKMSKVKEGINSLVAFLF